VTVWGEKCSGVDQGDAAAEWLAGVLERPGVRLVRCPDHLSRPANPK